MVGKLQQGVTDQKGIVFFILYIFKSCWHVVSKAAFNKKIPFTSKLDLELWKKLVKCYIWSIASYGVETWVIRKLDETYLEKFWNVVLEKDGEGKLDGLRK
jgi:hypothetical protein